MICATPKGMSRSDALRRTVALGICRDEEAAGDDVGLIPGCDEAFASWVAAEVAAGRMHRLEVKDAGKRSGTIWITVEGDRCHVVAAVIKPGGPDAVLEALPILERAARKLGCTTISCHTARVGLINRLSAVGFGLGEVLLVKNLPA